MASNCSWKAVLCFFVTSVVIHGVTARKFTVGGKVGWLPPASGAATYNDWAERHRFLIGDTLVFKYNPREDSVAQASAEDYNSCSTSNPKCSFKDGNTEFQMRNPGPSPSPASTVVSPPPVPASGVPSPAPTSGLSPSHETTVASPAHASVVPSPALSPSRASTVASPAPVTAVPSTAFSPSSAPTVASPAPSSVSPVDAPVNTAPLFASPGPAPIASEGGGVPSASAPVATASTRNGNSFVIVEQLEAHFPVSTPPPPP